MNQHLRPPPSPLKRIPWFFNGIRIISCICFWPFFRLHINGSAHLPVDAAFVLLPKHQRWVDIPLLGLASVRPLYYVAKYELFKNKISRWLIQSLGGIPLNRQRPIESRASLSATIEALRQGEGLVVFPEGTYYRDHMGPARLGLVKYLATHSDSRFIPVGIRYEEKFGPTRVWISFDRSMRPDQYSSPERFLEKAMQRIAHLSGLQPFP